MHGSTATQKDRKDFLIREEMKWSGGECEGIQVSMLAPVLVEWLSGRVVKPPQRFVVVHVEPHGEK